MANLLKHPDRTLGEVELVSSRFGTVRFEDDWVLVKKFDLPSGFNTRKSRLLIVLPHKYPEYTVKGYYLDKGLRKNGAKPEHYFEKKYLDKDLRKLGFAWYCLHIKKWKPNPASMVRGDNLLTAIKALYDALKYD